MTTADGPVPMVRVLAIVGTDIHPFDRMVRWVDDWLSRHVDEVEGFVQYGHVEPPIYGRGQQFLDHDDLEKRVIDSDIVVCHGGPSTITEARQRGLRPVVIPRRHSLGEHVDDHQHLFVRRLATDGLVLSASTGPEFTSLMDDVLADRSLVRVEPGDHTFVEESVQRFGALVDGLF